MFYFVSTVIVPPSQPIRFKTETSRVMVTCVFPALPEVSLLRVLIGFSFLRLAVAIALVLVLRHSIAQCSIICHINIESRQPRYRSFVTDLSRSQHVTYKLYHQALSDIIWTERSSEVWFHGKCNIWSNEGLKKVMNYISNFFWDFIWGQDNFFSMWT